MKNRVKAIPFFPNTEDNLHCLQACLKSVLSYFFPEKIFSDAEIDQKTEQYGGHTWFPPAVVFLDEIGLEVRLYGGIDYGQFSELGENYLRQRFTPKDYRLQEATGSFTRLAQVQNASKVMVANGLWQIDSLDNQELSTKLNNPNILAIGKTFQPWLSGNFEKRDSHYAVIIKSYKPTEWRIHDPGLPAFSDRKVLKTIQGIPMFPELLLIKGTKN